MDERKGQHYKDGELETILSMAPTIQNIQFLSELLGRSTDAIEIVYKLAFEHGSFGKDADIQKAKILEAKKRVGISIGRNN
jgi:hypothetical protein